jgi:hypothetical protein
MERTYCITNPKLRGRTVLRCRREPLDARTLTSPFILGSIPTGSSHGQANRVGRLRTDSRCSRCVPLTAAADDLRAYVD